MHVKAVMAGEPRLDLGAVVGGVVVGDQMDFRSGATCRLNLLLKRMNDWWRRFCMLWPITGPSSAPTRVVVPWRLSSWVVVPARSNFQG